MKYSFLLILIFLLSCNSRQASYDSKAGLAVKAGRLHTEISDDPLNSQDGNSETGNSDTEIMERFSDSVSIGEKGKCKIELIKHRVLDEVYVIVKFYTKGPKFWYIENTYLYECNGLGGFDAAISDFNNDRLNDITFISATAARGSNEVRRLFIYDDEKKELVSIVNSQEYPNIRYNSTLDCIDAFLVHGTSTSVFAKISGDSLKTFAMVHNNDDYHTIDLIDEKGMQKELFRVKSKGTYIRHKNYNPLTEYKEE